MREALESRLVIHDLTKVDWLRRNVLAVRTLDPNDDDFGDLMRLKDVIGNTRIVALGEQSHGDGATFQAKVRLVRFLHEKMGFNVLAWESGFFDCEEMDRALQSDQPLDQAVRQGVFAIWGKSALVRPIFAYARSSYKTAAPLRMTGFDIQFSGEARQTYAEKLFGYIDRVLPNLASREDRLTVEYLAATIGKSKHALTAEHRSQCQAVIVKLSEGLRQLNAREAEFFVKTLENLGWYEQLRGKGPWRVDRASEDFNLRDAKMGENIAWLARRWYPAEKMILWAASGHTARKVSSIPLAQYEGLTTMADSAERLIGQRVYSIGFTAYQGSIGGAMRRPSPLQLPDVDSLEAMLHAAGCRYGLLDFRGVPEQHWLRQPITARPFGYSQRTANWTDHFDAVFYIDVMFPDRQTR